MVLILKRGVEFIMNTTQRAKCLMKRWESFPTSPEDKVGELQEVFCNLNFLNGSETERSAVMLKYSETKYKTELEYPWDNYFSLDVSTLLRGKVALDLGCFSGGRGVAWFVRYKLEYLFGIDVKQEYIDLRSSLQP